MILLWARWLLFFGLLCLSFSQRVPPIALRRNVSKYIRERERYLNRTLKGSLQYILPTVLSMQGVVKRAEVISNFNGRKKDPIIMTAGSWDYAKVLINWVKHVKALKFNNFLVLCFDQLTFDLIGPNHGVLIDNDLKHKVNEHNKEAIRNKMLPQKEVPPYMKIRSSSQGVSTKVYSYSSYNSNLGYDRRPESINGSLKASKRCKFCVRHFEVVMMTKFLAISQVLKSGIGVIWSDLDAIWLRPCAYSLFSQVSSRVDIIAQRGTFPQSVNAKVGFTVCAGFFMARPTSTAQFFMEKTHLIIRKKMYTGAPDKDDQVNFNVILWNARAFRYEMSNLYSVYDFVYTNWNYSSIRIAMLPSALFPRLSDIKITNVSSPALSEQSRSVVDSNSISVESESASDISETLDMEGNFEDTEDDEREDVLDPNVTYLSLWPEYESNACIWHMLSDKIGISKIRTMQRDDVWRVSNAVSTLTFNSSVVLSSSSPEFLMLRKEMLLSFDKNHYSSNAKILQSVEKNLKETSKRLEKMVAFSSKRLVTSSLGLFFE